MSDNSTIKITAASAALVVAAHGAAASLPDGDTLIESDFGVALDNETLLQADLIAPLPDLLTPEVQGDSYLVAEQHDGTWFGGGGRDVIQDGPRRSFRERLFSGNALGGFAVLGGIILAGWAFVRRRNR